MDPGRERSLRWSVVDGCAHAFMLGTGETYLIPFAIFLGAGALTVGLISTAPLFLGALAQVATIYILERVRSRRALVVSGSAAQAVSWLPIFALPFIFPSSGPVLLLACTLVYVVLGNMIVPAWGSWMGDLVPVEIRGAWFGRRTRTLSIFTVVGLVGAGILLEQGRAHGWEWTAYGIVFGSALLARALSTFAHSRVENLPFQVPDTDQRFTFRDFIRRSGKSNFAKFVFFVGVFHASVFLAGPFFSLYMLRELGFTYTEFLAASVTVVVAQFLTLHTWGTLSDLVGNRRILHITGLLACIVPFLWLMSTSLVWILIIQVIAGVAWGGVNLSTSNFIFDAVSPPKRSRCFAYYNVVVQGGVLAGAVAGGWLAPRLGAQIELPGLLSLSFTWPLQTLFLLSGVARLVVILLLLPMFQEVRPVQPTRSWTILFNVVGIRPIRGLQFGITPEARPKDPPHPPPPPEPPAAQADASPGGRNVT